MWRVVLSMEAGFGGWLGRASDAGGLDFREQCRRLFLSYILDVDMSGLLMDGIWDVKEEK